MVELICIDVDGTLVGSSGVVMPEVWTVVTQLQTRGIRLALCSGRAALGGSRDYALRLGPSGWHIFQNGASIMQVSTGLSRSRCLAPAAVDYLIKRARQTNRVLELYTDTTYAVEQVTDRARRHADLLGIEFEARPFESLTDPVIRGQWVVAMAEVEIVLAEPYEQIQLTTSVSPVMPDTTFINMTSPGTDKGSALKALALEYGIELEHVMMIGDGDNDIGALRACGHPVAMGNAEPDVKAAARYQVGHVDRGGLIEALNLALSS